MAKYQKVHLNKKIWINININLNQLYVISVEFYHFGAKNDGEKCSRKNIFEIPSCAKTFSESFWTFCLLKTEFEAKKGFLEIGACNSVADFIAGKYSNRKCYKKCNKKLHITLLFYQVEPLKNGASPILPSCLSRES